MRDYSREGSAYQLACFSAMQPNSMHTLKGWSNGRQTSSEFRREHRKQFNFDY